VITRLEIENFKAIKHLAIDLDPLTVLVGPNDSGKSTILQALDLVARLVRNREPELHRVISSCKRDLDDAGTMRLVVSGTVGAPDDSDGYVLELTFGPEFAGDHLVSVSLDWKGAARSFRVNYRGALDELPPSIAGDLDSRLVAFDPRALARPCPSDAAFAPDGSGLAALLLRLRTDLDERPFNALVEDLRRMSPFVTSLGLDTHTQAGMVGARFAIGADRRALPADAVSSGVLLMSGYLAHRHGTTAPASSSRSPRTASIRGRCCRWPTCCASWRRRVARW
jgi:energy-coupling factor transporter ATP-binding protein EcfA2